MTILWMGGEDIDFPNGSAAQVNTSGSSFRSGYARCSLTMTTAPTFCNRGNSFPGGTVTSAWLHFYLLYQSSGTSSLMAGFGLNSGGTGGVYVGNDSTTATKIAIWKWDGTTKTKLATESGTSLTSARKIDMQIINHGATATVNVYVDGVLAVTFSGSTVITGFANFDCVAIGPGGGNAFISEIIVADADTRTMNLVTLAPNANGDVNNWTTGTFSSINPTTINDANVIAVNTTGQDFQANLIDLPAGSFSINAVKVIARTEVTAGSTPTGVKLGVKSGGTVDVGSLNTPGAAFTNLERLMTTNPVTSAAWTQSDVNALQIDLRSG